MSDDDYTEESGGASGLYADEYYNPFSHLDDLIENDIEGNIEVKLELGSHFDGCWEGTLHYTNPERSAHGIVIYSTPGLKGRVVRGVEYQPTIDDVLTDLLRNFEKHPWRGVRTDIGFNRYFRKPTP